MLGQVAIDLAPVVMEGAQFEGSLQLLQPSTDLAPPTQGSVGVVADVALKVVKPFLSMQNAGNRYLWLLLAGSTYICIIMYVHTDTVHFMSVLYIHI